MSFLIVGEFCKRSMCHLLTFASYIRQFAAVRGFNRASATAEMCSARRLLAGDANKVTESEGIERKRVRWGQNERKELCV